MKPPKLGTVWTAAATLYNKDGKAIARCLDTPNSIANALKQLKNADTVKTLGEYRERSAYLDRMGDWNKAETHLVIL